MNGMGVLDILGPFALVVAAIAAVAAVYFIFTAIKDRRARAREERLAAEARARRTALRRRGSHRSDGSGSHMR